MALTRTLIHEWTKTRPAQAGHNYKVFDMTKKQEIIARLAFWLGFAVVAFVYMDIALDILAN